MPMIHGLHLTDRAGVSLVLARCFCRLNLATTGLLGENGCFLVTADYWKRRLSRRYSYLQDFHCNSVWLSTFWVCAYGSICFLLCSSSRPGTNITLRATLKPAWERTRAQ